MNFFPLTTIVNNNAYIKMLNTERLGSKNSVFFIILNLTVDEFA